jgi:hypothetical protein
LGSRPRTHVRSVLELDALCRNSLLRNSCPVENRLSFSALSLVPDFGAEHAHLGGVQRFCANFLRVLKDPNRVKVESGFLFHPCFRRNRTGIRTGNGLALWRLAQRKLSNSSRQQCPSRLSGLAGVCLLGLAMGFVLSRDSLEELRGGDSQSQAPASPGPTNQLPTSLNPDIDWGRPFAFCAFAPQATGRLHCLATTLLD